MRDALDRIDTQNPGLILKFGGHAMAYAQSTGFSIDGLPGKGLSLTTEMILTFSPVIDFAVIVPTFFSHMA
jgi:hypothetical protein